MSKIIVVANLKGGVGKSTLATNIACVLARDMSAVLVDADDHQATSWWGRKAPSPVPVVSARFEPGKARDWSKAVLGRPEEVVVVDVGGGQVQAVTIGMTIADLVIIPCPATPVDIKTAKDTVAILAEARAKRRSGPAALLVPNRVDRRRAAGREVEAALHRLKEPVSPAVMERAAFADAFGVTSWIGSYAPKSAGHHEIEAITAIIRGQLWEPSEAA